MKIEKITPAIAALYLGQKCTYSSKALIEPIETEINARVLSDMEDGFASITLHLRRLRSMTEEEAREVYRVYMGQDYFGDSCLLDWWNFKDGWYQTMRTHSVGYTEIWVHLLSKGFDLFGLIPAGLAKEIVAQS